jgi:lipopolysaccharide export system ATP-binding protein
VPRLSLDGLGKSYRGRRVVNGVRLSVESGRVVGLLGPNGAGKTTTFYMAVGLITPDAGRVFLDDDDITGLPMYLRARRGIGYLPQETSVFRKLTVRQNIVGMLEFFGFSRSRREERAAALLDELGIRRLADQRAASLSGGERRRLEISRALALDPAFILLDEPFAGVDPLAVSDIKQIIFHLKHRNIGVLISDHNVRETLGACDEAYIMSAGEVIEVGSPDQIAASETARRMYLGDEFRL